MTPQDSTETLPQGSKAFEFNGSNNRPLLVAYTRPGVAKREITLWINERATAANEKAPDLRGHLQLTDREGHDNKIPVSGWFRQEEGKEPRIILHIALSHGGELLGSIRAMKNYLNQPADGSKGLRLSGDLEVPAPHGVFTLTVAGEMNREFKDRDVVFDSARSLGFPENMVQDFANRLVELDALKARQAVQTDNARSAATAMQP